MRILLSVPSLGREFGGPVGKARALADALRTLGHDVLLAGAGPDGGEPSVVSLGRRGGFHGTPIPARLRSLRAAVRGADVVHVIGFRDPVGTVAALAARRRGIPVVLEPVGMLTPRVRSRTIKQGFDATLGRAVVSSASAVVVTSSIEREDVLRAGVPAPRVVVRPNGLDLDDLLPLPPRGPLRDRLGIPPERPLVVTLARIAAIKGLPTMARALGSLPNVWWLLAGPDERDGTLTAVRRALADVGAADRAVVLPGGLWGDDKRAALAEADVVCLPSEYESFGSAAVEAAAVGVPVVVTDGCGGAELFTDAGPWSVVPTADPDAIATAIDALRGSDRSDQHASELRHLLAWETVAARQVRIYAAAVDQRAD